MNLGSGFRYRKGNKERMQGSGSMGIEGKKEYSSG